MEQVIITNDLSELAMSIAIPTWEKSTFTLKEWLIKNLLSSIHTHPKQRNIYGYLTEISSFKWIFSIMRELIENDEKFRNYLKDTLKDQYFSIEQIIRFVRNVLNHGTTTNLVIKLEDYEIQKDFILSPKVQRVNNLKGSALINLNFVYSKYITQWKGSPDYWINLSVDFKCLKPGIQLEKLISWHDLYLLSELCYNLSLLMDAKHKTWEKPIRKSIQANNQSMREKKNFSQRKSFNRNKK